MIGVQSMTITLSRRDLLLGITVSLPGWAMYRQIASLRAAHPAPNRTAQIRSPAEIQLPPIDATRIAKRVVASVQPTTGERAIFVYDPTYYPELARAIYMELSGAGVYPIIALTFDPQESIGTSVGNPLAAVRALAANPAEAKKREEEVVRMLRPIFENADIFLWLPARDTWPDLRWERLVDASRVRGIHFHWIIVPDGRSVEEIRALTRMYERSVLDTDYAMISKEQDRIINAIRGKNIRVTTAGGTDLRMHVPRNAWFHKDDGDMSPARARQAKSVRDRELEIPVGALRFIPDSGSVEGRLALSRVPTGDGIAEGVTIEFERGRATRLRAEKNEAAFRAAWESVGGDIDKVGEIVLGTNPLLVTALPSGELPYFGYGAGYLRVSLGDNWESGGTNRSPLGRPLWFLLERASLEADGQAVTRDDRLVK
ncbi:MAG: hypothetical protein C5B44_01245 [Acidobacteria bacterium]|nr:MAG: hypothetical protein C5B44_01245 [Acidobacteriota bacterium]